MFVPETDKQNAAQDQCFTLQTFSTAPGFTFTMFYFIPISANDSQLTYFNDTPLFHVEGIIMILMCHLSILCDYCNNVICVCSSFFLFKFKLTEYRPFVTVVQFILVYFVCLFQDVQDTLVIYCKKMFCTRFQLKANFHLQSQVWVVFYLRSETFYFNINNYMKGLLTKKTSMDYLRIKHVSHFKSSLSII